MGLQFVNHLQFMLDVTQEHVGFLQEFSIGGLQEIEITETLQTRDCIRLKQLWVCDSVQELKRLDNEFNVTNSPGTEFDVALIFPFSLDFLMNLSPEFMNGIDHASGFPFFPPHDERPDFPEKGLP